MDSKFIELSGQIASSAGLCDFLASGGRVFDQDSSDGWRDVTAEVLRKERRKVAELERVRRMIYPEHLSEELAGRSQVH